jgi:hypothetical protein
MTPLLPAGGAGASCQSKLKSKSVNSSFEMMSTARRGVVSVMAPSTIVQFVPTSVPL